MLRGHESLDDAAELDIPEALEAHEEVAINPPLESYPRGPFDTSLLHLYVEHAAKHV